MNEIDIMKSFFNQRAALYELRKKFMLAKLQKDYEILFNKVKFIQAVISEQIKINRVKRKAILKSLEQFGLKKFSQLEAIMAEFTKVGPNKKTVAALNPNENEEETEEVK